MRVKSVTFGFTKNLGNYQSAKADVTIELQEDESFDSAMVLAAALVKDTLDEKLDEAEQEALLKNAHLL